MNNKIPQGPRQRNQKHETRAVQDVLVHEGRSHVARSPTPSTRRARHHW